MDGWNISAHQLHSWFSYDLQSCYGSVYGDQNKLKKTSLTSVANVVDNAKVSPSFSQRLLDAKRNMLKRRLRGRTRPSSGDSRNFTCVENLLQYILCGLVFACMCQARLTHIGDWFHNVPQKFVFLLIVCQRFFLQATILQLFVKNVRRPAASCLSTCGWWTSSSPMLFSIKMIFHLYAPT